MLSLTVMMMMALMAMMTAVVALMAIVTILSSTAVVDDGFDGDGDDAVINSCHR